MSRILFAKDQSSSRDSKETVIAFVTEKHWNKNRCLQEVWTDKDDKMLTDFVSEQKLDVYTENTYSTKRSFKKAKEDFSNNPNFEFSQSLQNYLNNF